MNKSKIIFMIIWIIILAIIIYTIPKLLERTEKKSATKIPKWAFVIRTIQDDKNTFQNFITEFKKKYPQYSATQIIVESFPSYEDYFYTLTSAFNKWTWPDLFVLNNNETSVLEEQALGLGTDIISINDFRKNYKTVFSQDLIKKDPDTKKEYIIWIPMGYESLWIFYNRRFFNSEELKTWENINKKIYTLEQKWNDTIPIWIWNWSTVSLSSEILTQLLVLEWWNNIKNIGSEKIIQAVNMYKQYWESNSEKNYNSILPISSKKNNLDLFSAWEIWAIIWYPRTLKEIDEKWYSPNFLLSSPFPIYWGNNSNKTFINYNYFCINKVSDNPRLWVDMLDFMTTRLWAGTYLNNSPYYIPAQTVLKDEVIELEQKINKDYNILYKDFIMHENWNNWIESELTSFNKWIRVIYDREVPKLLDTQESTSDLFENFIRKLSCKANKALNFINLSSSCE